MPGRGPLEGVTVIEISNMLMGPFATMALAQMGARVIKVEPPGGDIARGIADSTGRGLGPIYLNINRGKESIELDLADPGDRSTFEALVAAADVVAHNRPPGSEVRLGVDYATLSRINPRIIVCAMYGFGADGPYGSLGAYDDVMQGISGIAAHQTGEGPPQYVRTPLTDKIAGIVAVGAISSALYERERSGSGQLVEVPMFETMVGFLLAEQQGECIYDPPRGPAGYARTNSPHRHPYATADGLISILASTDAHWTALFRLLGESELSDDPRFASIRARTENIDELYAWLKDALARHPTAQLLAQLHESRVPAMRVNTIEDLFVDPHLVQTGFFERVEHPEAGALRQPAAPVRFSRSGSAPLHAAPSLGADGPRLRHEFGCAGTM
ncbi:CaiB/BaiF CoA transferase family protein [Microbacterium immunditiarum]|uniref:Crotonobetainyl-CoA:carnitine CoA-transferase CaiB-like acyl-CoA transferase n=1 Tax=Microbacterium immunditiarum TaxID=337480 RepID=A0A7Y9KK37_9MICO|nr:CoA transferase [Microbacterium immunditiarum]NYE18803.1 crotonobetainyl-CoA:carnitine CoA-transferase CaiB-like acyl-CoA transferase [Microbacterium immunditiarum]